MSNDLITRLRDSSRYDSQLLMREAAADRIEELEAALRHYVCFCVAPNCEVASLDSCICGLAARRALEKTDD